MIGLPAGGPGRPLRQAGLLALAAALAAALGACAGPANLPPEGLSYYAQSVRGHLDMLQRARPLADWLADPATPPALRQRLQLARQLRDFAVRELALPDNASYQSYADLGRSAVVWNVVAAPELSLTLKTWCYPLMGCVGYRGYFDRAAADAEALRQREAGLEVLVYGVPAYSTLGWTNWLGGDPLLNTFVGGSEAVLARLIFHELSHQVAFASGDTLFNESYATAVERLGLARWLAATGRADDEPDALRRVADFRALTLAARQALQAVYEGDLPEAEKRQRKATLMAALRADYQAMKAAPGGAWGDYSGFDPWFARANNAALAIQAAYDGLVPDFERLFEREGRDFARFHAEVRRLAKLPRAERRATLQSLQSLQSRL